MGKASSTELATVSSIPIHGFRCAFSTTAAWVLDRRITKQGTDTKSMLHVVWAMTLASLKCPFFFHYSEVDHRTANSFGATESICYNSAEPRNDTHVINRQHWFPMLKGIPSRLTPMWFVFFLFFWTFFMLAVPLSSRKLKSARWFWRTHWYPVQKQGCRLPVLPRDLNKALKELMESVADCLLSSVWNQTSDLYLRWQV